jgi:hypothetical protein
MIFANSFTESTYWMDNVELYKVNVQTVDPHDRHVLLANPTGAAIEVPLTGCWRDVLGVLHSGSISVPAFGSLVLAKENDGLCGLTTAVEEPLTSIDEQFLLPNPVASGSPVFLGQEVTSITDVEVFDGGGRSVHRSRIGAGTRELPISDALTGGQYVILLRNDSGVRHHRLMVL